MAQKKKELPASQPKKIMLQDIIRLQLIWYLINFLILFFQNHVSFELSYFNNLYQVTFKVIGRSFFISLLLYSVTNRNLSFEAIGFSFNNFFPHFKLGTKLSSIFIIGTIIVNLSLPLAKFNPLIKVNNLSTLSQSLLYFILVFLGLLIPAFSKELFYRGVLYQYFSENWGLKAGFLFTNLYYAASYLDFRIESISIHLLVGIITTYLYHKTDSLIASTVFQTAYQAGLTVYLFSFSHWPF